jgi:Mn-dependent DtxR family transcriptional regulator
MWRYNHDNPQMFMKTSHIAILIGKSKSETEGLLNDMEQRGMVTVKKIKSAWCWSANKL